MAAASDKGGETTEPSKAQEGPLNSGDVSGLEGLAKLALVPLIAEAPRPPVGTPLPRAPRFGPPGASSSEQACGHVHVYMRTFGRVMEKRRVILPPESSLASARTTFEKISGSPLTQEDTRDEDGYLIAASELSQPLWKFASGCNLNLNFTHGVTRSLQQEPDAADAAGSPGGGRNVFV